MRGARSAVVKQIVVSTVLMGVMMAVFFTSAGRRDLPRAWLFFGAAFIYFVASTLAVYRFNPELLIARLTLRREGSKTWDEVLMRVANLTGMLLIPAVAGLDVGRYGWSGLNLIYVAPGFALFVLGAVLITWAMIVNRYFESTVRIQEDRDHEVVSTGPYGFVRHPGYLSGILWMSSIPLIIGSLYTLIPVMIYGAMIVLRTHLEDRTLRDELPGYSEYAERVKYRLVPWIW
ncbi:isoprenylcysteine carboxylmethyltransferase family protein [Candidatus Bathyarchaeota archaeon]|nr:isoprenylcysteine carboxylmethyltransferase family protein [Candidatus Bathyarchaeota archaeon]